MSGPHASRLEDAAAQVAEALARRDVRVVFAESCTAGLVAAALSRTAGISQYLCGSAVTYRDATKLAWLGVESDDLARHGAVSEPVARQMALGVLERTAEADYGAAITGHLGPDAPAEWDGVVFVAVAKRGQNEPQLVELVRQQLKSTTRHERQQEAAVLMLGRLSEALDSR